MARRDDSKLGMLRYSATDGDCDAACKDALQIKLTEVLGTSGHVVVGGLYLVRGKYWLKEPLVQSVVLAGIGRTTGKMARLLVGEGNLEITAEPQEVAVGRDKELDIVMTSPARKDLGVRLRIELRGE